MPLDRPASSSAAPTSPCPGALVICLTAKLRMNIFKWVANAGYRVDGVADQRSADKRLAKDRYDLIVYEAGVVDPATLPVGSRTIEVAAESSIDEASFIAQLQLDGKEG